MLTRLAKLERLTISIFNWDVEQLELSCIAGAERKQLQLEK